MSDYPEHDKLNAVKKMHPNAERVCAELRASYATDGFHIPELLPIISHALYEVEEKAAAYILGRFRRTKTDVAMWKCPKCKTVNVLDQMKDKFECDGCGQEWEPSSAFAKAVAEDAYRTQTNKNPVHAEPAVVIEEKSEVRLELSQSKLNEIIDEVRQNAVAEERARWEQRIGFLLAAGMKGMKSTVE